MFNPKNLLTKPNHFIVSCSISSPLHLLGFCAPERGSALDLLLLLLRLLLGVRHHAGQRVQHVAATIAAFQSRVSPILKDIQSQGGLDRFKVIIDTTTTTQADIENNTIRGRIFLQPTRSVEFVSLDFVVSNSI